MNGNPNRSRQISGLPALNKRDKYPPGSKKWWKPEPVLSMVPRRPMSQLPPVTGVHLQQRDPSHNKPAQKTCSAPQLMEINELLSSLALFSRYLGGYSPIPRTPYDRVQQMEKKHLQRVASKSEPESACPSVASCKAWRRRMENGILRHTKHLEQVSKKAKSQRRHLEKVQLNKRKMDEPKVKRYIHINCIP